jgi:hypothetical protein
MKMTTLEKWVLLEQSGELSPRRQRKLEACPETQAKRDEYQALCAAVQIPDVEPSPWAVTKIAARLREERHPVLTFSKVWKPVFLTAACLTLVVSTFNLNQAPSGPSALAVVTAVEADEWNVQFEEDLVELESLILAISGDPIDTMEM